MIKAIDIFFILLALAIFVWGITRRTRLWRIGKDEDRSDQIWTRLKSFFKQGIVHTRILKDPYPGLLHLFVFLGLLIPLIVIIITQFKFTLPLILARFISLMLDLIGIAAFITVLLFLYRRLISRPSRLDNNTDDVLTLCLLLLILLTGFIIEGLRLSVIGKDTHAWAPAGNLAALLFNATGLTTKSKGFLTMLFFRIHFFLVLGTFAYIPYSKLFHLVSSPLNMVFRSLSPSPALTNLDLEDEKTESFGISKIEEFTWKHLMDLDACTRCGRCQDHCPAHLTQKPLSPKSLITDLKNHMHRRAPQILKARSSESNLEEVPPLAGNIIEEDVLWTCTTCRSCMEHCPVYIEHVDKIVEMRRYQVLMESKFPKELNAFLRSMETNSNPWGIGFASRADWSENLEVKLIKDFPEAEYLFWVGCAGSFDEEGKKIARALVSIMNKAGLSFSILGTEEKCCGDQVRRLGNEYLFQMQAAENIEVLAKYKVKKIITICPHGYNIFKNEYPLLLDVLSTIPQEMKDSIKKIEVIHHVQLIHRLLKEGKLSLKAKLDATPTYHDSCYLGRYNGIFKEPREILSAASPYPLAELKNNREHSFCCGAGGGLMWTEESLGTRINHMRTDEVIATQAGLPVTSCPFCLTMLQDGLKDKNKTDIKVKDIAQVVAELLT